MRTFGRVFEEAMKLLGLLVKPFLSLRNCWKYKALLIGVAETREEFAGTDNALGGRK